MRRTSGQLQIPSLSLCPGFADGAPILSIRLTNKLKSAKERASDSEGRTAGWLVSGMRAAGQWQNWPATRISHRRMKALLGEDADGSSRAMRRSPRRWRIDGAL